MLTIPNQVVEIIETSSVFLVYVESNEYLIIQIKRPKMKTNARIQKSWDSLSIERCCFERINKLVHAYMGMLDINVLMRTFL